MNWARALHLHFFATSCDSNINIKIKSLKMITLLLSTVIIEYGKETQKFRPCPSVALPPQGSGGRAASSWRRPAVRIPKEMARRGISFSDRCAYNCIPLVNN